MCYQYDQLDTVFARGKFEVTLRGDFRKVFWIRDVFFSFVHLGYVVC